MNSKKKASALNRLLSYGGKKAYLLRISIFLSAISGICLLMPMVFIHKILSGVIITGTVDSASVWANALYATGFAIGGFLLYMLCLILSHIFAFEVEHNIVKQNMEKMMNKPLGFFANRESGKLRKIIVDGAGQTHTFLAHQLPDFASALLSPVVLLVFFIVFDWRLGLISLIPIILGFIFMMLMMGKKGIEKRNRYFASMADLSAEAVEYVRGMPVVKTFAQSVESFERFHSLINETHESVMEMTLSWKNKYSFVEAVASSTAFFIVPAGIMMLSRGADLKTVLGNSVIYLLIGPAFNMYVMRSMQISHFKYFAEQALDRIDGILEYEDFAYGTESGDDEGRIEFKGVSFSYGGEKVLDNLSFRVDKGQTVAIVGASGGGKTTIARLASRFYDVDEGEILLGNTNIKAFEKEDLMRRIAFVFQDSHLFKTSLLENLRIAKPDASEAEIEEALSKAGAKEIVDRLPEGLQTVFGSKGTYFSGGEIQRLCIARAFLKNAGILILDEATAFADPENEKLIQASFKELAKDRTTLMIAHRLSTVVDADKILLVEGGKIAESGTHKELLAKNGRYKALWEEYQRAAKWRIGGEDA